MVDVAEKTLKEVDVILWLVEPSNFISEQGERHIENIFLEKVNAPVLLIISKTDTVEVKTKSWNSSIRTASCSSLPR